MGLTGLQQEAAVRTVLALRQVQPFDSLAMMFMASPELAAALEGSVGTASAVLLRSRPRRAGRPAPAGHGLGSARPVHRRHPDILQWIEGEG
jgi:hypothetical protein